MNAKEKINAAIASLDEECLEELYKLVEKFAESKQQRQKKGLLSRLRNIKIDGPQDFAANLDDYLAREKVIDSNIY